MLVVNQKYKPIKQGITKPTETDYTTSVMPSVQGKGINELIARVKDMKIKESHKKRNADNKISFD
jgi:hypothetical protein